MFVLFQSERANVSPRKTTRRQFIRGARVAAMAVPLVPVAALAEESLWDKPLHAGVRRVVADEEVVGSVVLMPGARIEIGPGVTLRFRGDFFAPAERVFFGEGAVDFINSRVVAVRPEWWGAIADDPACDCLDALRACVSASLSVQLGAGDYFVSATWEVNLPMRRIWGIGRSKDMRGTRVLLAGGGGTVMRVGTRAAPREINDYVKGIDLRWIEVGRSKGPAGTGEPAIGLEISHVLDCAFEGVRATEHSVGFSARGAVRSFLRDCTAFRSLPNAVSGGTGFTGFELDGRRPPIPTGANASLYIDQSNVTLGGDPSLPFAIGARIRGAMSDLFLTQLETTRMTIGIDIDGAAAERKGPRSSFDQINVTIDAPVLDQCAEFGIRMARLSPAAMVQIGTPYLALRKEGAAGVMITESAGSIQINGGQLIGESTSGAPGFWLRDCDGIGIAGASLRDWACAARSERCRNFELSLTVLATRTSASAALEFADCDRGVIKPRISSFGGTYASGVAVDGKSRRLAIETLLIDPSALGPRAPVVRTDPRAKRTDFSTLVTIDA